MTHKFTLNRSVLRLPVGTYEVLGRDGEEQRYIFGTFSNTLVKNVLTGKEFSIPTGNAQALGLLPYG